MKRITLVLSLLAAACGPNKAEPDGGGDGDGDGDGGGDGDGDAASLPDAAATIDGPVGCNPQSFTLQQSPPAEVYLVLDRSGSMTAPGTQPNTTLWDELNNAVDYMVTTFDASIRFGLLMYPSNSECATSGPQVGIAADNGPGIMFELSNATPAGGTPTAAALTNAASSLIDLGSLDSPKFLVLVSDGGPNCNYFLDAPCSCTYASSQYCCTSYPQTCGFGQYCLDDQRSVDVVTDLHLNEAIDTFVIGFAGANTYATLLDAMAEAGGRPQMNAATKYYAADNQAELQAALETIAVSVISCVIQLDMAPDDPDGVRIWIDGEEIPRDATETNGWNYTDGTYTAIELFGAACGTLQDGNEHNVTATFPCVVP